MRPLHEAIAQATVTQDEAEGRVYGVLTGVVTDIDPKSTAAKVRIGKQGDNESSHWMPQVGMGGMESVPEVGDPVGVVFQDGDSHRGFYFYFPQSNTGGRPTESMMLGSTFLGMFNFLVTQLNQLRSDFHTFVTSTYNTHNHPTAPPGVVSIPSVVGTGTSAVAANKGKKPDGSVVPDKATSEVVLSKRGKLR